MKNAEIYLLKTSVMMKNASMEWAIEELARISDRCSNTVQDDILTVIDNLKKATEYENL